MPISVHYSFTTAYTVELLGIDAGILREVIGQIYGAAVAPMVGLPLKPLKGDRFVGMV